MRDLEIAKQALKEKNLTLAIAKDGKIIFQSNLRGVIGIFKAIDELGGKLESSAVADKIVGKAAALLFAYLHVAAVFASVLSVKGKDTLEKNGIKYEFEFLVPKILNRTGRDMCPFEKFSLDLENPEEAYFKLKGFAEKLLKEN
ncbi:hypothetical protein DRO54_12185 [Candidatus Bathyarchaeota archaeon]|nr:MAG: hypothetical protein DRO54_12185 [Candidatus Bathyarchaeota archaeon]